MKPFATNAQGKKVQKAGKEYLQHAASLQVHFLELTAMIKRGLRARLLAEQSSNQAELSETGEGPSLFTSVYNWFVAKPEESSVASPRAEAGNDRNEPVVKKAYTVVSDKKFLQAL